MYASHNWLSTYSLTKGVESSKFVALHCDVYRLIQCLSTNGYLGMQKIEQAESVKNLLE